MHRRDTMTSISFAAALAVTVAAAFACGGSSRAKIAGQYDKHGKFPTEYGHFVFTNNGDVEVVSTEADRVVECSGSYSGPASKVKIALDCKANEAMDNPAFSVTGTGKVTDDGKTIRVSWGKPVNGAATLTLQTIKD